MRLTFLRADVPLTKSFTRSAAGGGISKEPYPFVTQVTSSFETVSTLSDLAKALQAHADQGHCLLKGDIATPLVNESRAGSTVSAGDTEYIVLDLDGLPIDKGLAPEQGVEEVLNAIGLKEVSYVLQWSASQGIYDTALRAHIFIMLDTPTPAPLIKQWLIGLNLSTPLLSRSLALTKTGNSLTWPLDISACQNDKLIYITPPVLKGVKDPFARAQRITCVPKKKKTFALLNAVAIPSTSQNREATVKKVLELRDLAGLPKRKITFKMHGSTEVMLKPDACTITGRREERGFVYFNLNGGDSWAYYHPEGRPEFIYNFKGEPTYLTRELVPDYWEELTQAEGRANSQGVIYLAFMDRSTSVYWRGTYDTSTDRLDIGPVKNATQLRDAARQNGKPIGDSIPEWDLTFDPQTSYRVDIQNRRINTFEPTPFMLAPKPTTSPTFPPITRRVISNALGGAPETIDYFINWLAFILQRRDRTGTAWILHGVSGTGKGVMMDYILRPLFGYRQTAARRMEELNEPYNHYMRNALLVFVDEMQAKALLNPRGVMARLKNFITERVVTIREMYSGGVEVRNYTNWIFASNMSDPVTIDPHDRRWNVGTYQPNKLQITQAEIDQIQSELQDFHDFLAAYPVDEHRARTPLDSQDRTTMIALSQSSIDSVSLALTEGQFGFFVDLMPTTQTYRKDALAFNKVESYRELLVTLLARTTPASGQCNISRDELKELFDYAVGNMPESPNKFTSLVKHHRIYTKVVKVDGRPVNGLTVHWKDTKEWPAYSSMLSPPAPRVTKPPSPPTPPKKKAPKPTSLRRVK